MRIKQNKQLLFNRYSKYDSEDDESHSNNHNGSCVHNMREGEGKDSYFIMEDDNKAEAEN